MPGFQHGVPLHGVGVLWGYTHHLGLQGLQGFQVLRRQYHDDVIIIIII